MYSCGVHPQTPSFMQTRIPKSLLSAPWQAVAVAVCLACLVCLLAPGQLAAATIPGLYNTGVDNARVTLANSAVDPHYRLIQSADPASPGPNAIVVIDTLFPIVSGPWLATSPQSKWIAPKADQSGGSSAGDYVYR